LGEAVQAVNDAHSSLLYSSNFSIGVNVFYRIAWFAGQLMNSFPEYDIGGFEAHHNKKLDSPSGTAKILVDGILSRVDRKKKAVWETLNRAPAPDELHFPSLRIGSAPGTHSLIFDSAADTIEIKHTARSREGLASGAVSAAEWLYGKPNGIYTMDEMLKDKLGI
ncbi:MAG: 4-hydroxy-tetrahydrodipicolinate reductase, partial [Treponema sp.]|nr:4-hydroxy-tetrahydrodipicolinate reductase [Treponema sp.]